MRDAKDQLDDLDAIVLIVSFESAATIRRFGWFRTLPFRALSDPDRLLYGAFGLRSRPLRQLLDRTTVRAYLRGILHLRIPRTAGTDVHQLGGDVVLNRTGDVVFVYRSATPADRPSVELLLHMLTKAGGE